jgi:hypothetical protein
LALHEQAGSSWQVRVAQANLMDSLLAGGQVDEAIGCGEALLQQLRSSRALAALPAARLNLAGALLSRDDGAQARVHALEGWPQALQLSWQPYWADYLALLAAIEGRPQAAARLIGYADARYAAAGTAREINEARAVERAGRLVAARLGAAAFERLKAAGAKIGDDDVAGLAFATEDPQ